MEPVIPQTEIELKTTKIIMVHSCIEELIAEIQEYIEEHDQFQYSVYN